VLAQLLEHNHRLVADLEELRERRTREVREALEPQPAASGNGAAAALPGAWS
jgi:hypothetical protein